MSSGENKSTVVGSGRNIKTQKGSRTLQKYLDIITVNELDILINNIKNDMKNIMIDIYGNYFLRLICNIYKTDTINWKNRLLKRKNKL